MKEKKGNTVKQTSSEDALNAAIDSIYKKYGNDLQAFFRDVYKNTSEQSEKAHGTRKVIHV
jgi:hypothetical protein